jgi:hypothetical protein
MERTMFQRRTNAVLPAILLCFASTSTPAEDLAPGFQHRIYEGLPTTMAQSSRNHLNEVTKASLSVATMRPYYIIVQHSRRWTPGKTLTIAFNGGTDDLYTKIEDAASAWTQPNAANLKLAFKDNSGQYRHWSTSDQNYVADIRIGFINEGDYAGNWSAIGTDSRDNTVEGGAPNQGSMNFGGFDQQLPVDWEGTVRHEFGHALGFEHEHQSPSGGCDFRLDDDPGYVKTTDAEGWYTTDSKGRRPGLYTYLGGKANYWPKDKVDANLKTFSSASTRNYLLGPFDKLSIMKYYFEPAMFKKGAKSPCYTGTENEVLSAQDLVGVQKAYPRDPAAAKRIATEQAETLQSLVKVPFVSGALKSGLNQRLDVMMMREE